MKTLISILLLICLINVSCLEEGKRLISNSKSKEGKRLESKIDFDAQKQDSLAKENISIIGEWKYIDDNECPDLIVISADGMYSIFNDCYSENPEKPIIEKGIWRKNNSELIFLEREFISESSSFIDLYGAESELSIKIELVTATKMKLCFVKNGNCIKENYLRK